MPFIPEEKELDELIAASRSQRMTACVQTLKETMADPTEALRLRWIDINGNIISINAPVKGHRPRQLEVSSRLIAMLKGLPKTSELIFPTNYRAMQSTFVKVQKRVAYKLQNPTMLKISFVTFRHWGATMATITAEAACCLFRNSSTQDNNKHHEVYAAHPVQRRRV